MVKRWPQEVLQEEGGGRGGHRHHDGLDLSSSMLVRISNRTGWKLEGKRVVAEFIDKRRYDRISMAVFMAKRSLHPNAR